MARARTGGPGAGYAWALVIFGVGFVICLLLAIIFGVQLSGARQQTQEAQSTLAKYASPSEQSRPEFQALATGGKTVVGALAAQNSTLKQMISGDANASIDTLKKRLDQLNVQASLTRKIESLEATLKDAQDQVKQAQAAAQQQREAAAQALKQQKQLAADYQNSVKQLTGQISQIKNSFNAYQSKGGKVAAGLQTQYKQAVQAKDKQITGLQNQIRQLQTDKQQLQAQLTKLTGGPGQAAPQITQPDAQVTMVLADRNEVYLNRGSDDKIQLGMTFEVFPQGQLVQINKTAGGGQEVRGKATVEVVSTQAHSSLARIVRVAVGADVRQGDELINLIYDPHAVYKFFVYGDFDLDHDGQYQPSEQERIKHMITQWGGKLADKLSYDVDFLVLGHEPSPPQPLPQGVIDPQKIQAHVQAEKDYKQYLNLLAEAQKMNIPVLNQNRFLTLVGYYQR